MAMPGTYLTSSLQGSGEMPLQVDGAPRAHHMMYGVGPRAAVISSKTGVVGPYFP